MNHLSRCIFNINRKSKHFLDFISSEDAEILINLIWFSSGAKTFGSDEVKAQLKASGVEGARRRRLQQEDPATNLQNKCWHSAFSTNHVLRFSLTWLSVVQAQKLVVRSLEKMLLVLQYLILSPRNVAAHILHI